MNIEAFSKYGEVKVFSAHPEFFHMVINGGFNESKTFGVMNELIAQGITKRYPVVAVNVTGENLFDVVLVPKRGSDSSSEQRKRIEDLSKELLSIPEDKLQAFVEDYWIKYDDTMDAIEILAQEIKDHENG